MHALANINMLRLWGGAGIWNPAMLQACDEAGILLWLEFWITGDDDGRGSGDSQCPLDHKLWCVRASCKSRCYISCLRWFRQFLFLSYP